MPINHSCWRYFINLSTYAKDKYAGSNNWVAADLSTTELLNTLTKRAEHLEGKGNATTTQTNTIPTRGTQSDNGTERTGRGTGESLDSGVASTSEGTTGKQSVPTSVSSTSGTGTTSTSGSYRNEPSSGSRETSDARDQSSAANDFNIGDTKSLGEGSIAKCR